MNTYTYYDNTNKHWEKEKFVGATVLFQCQAESLSKADGMFEKEIGQSPIKIKNVGVVVTTKDTV